MHRRSGFTLIELLVVIAIIAVLAVAVVLTLNPAGLLQQSRDANRLSNMATLNGAINLVSADGIAASFGSINTLYVSVPDPTATSSAGDQCQGLGMPVLPSGWSYQCAPSSTYRSANGTGWIPINFSQTTFGTPLVQLPIDPTNTTSSGLYYEYMTDGQHYEVAAAMESQKYLKSSTIHDGGIDPVRYEIGSTLSLLPQAEGLAGLWTFDEGSGSAVADTSGNGNTGTALGTLPYFATGKVGAYAGNFDGSDNYVNIPDPVNGSLDFGASTDFTLVAWVKATNLADSPFIIDKRHSFGGVGNVGYTFYLDTSGRPQLILADGTHGGAPIGPSSGSYADSNWHLYAIVISRAANTATFFVDGTQIYSASLPASLGNINSALSVEFGAKGASEYLTGFMDDARIYGRALSPADISVLYNAEN